MALCFQLHQGGFLRFEINILNIIQQDKNKALVALCFELHQGCFFALLQKKNIDFKHQNENNKNKTVLALCFQLHQGGFLHFKIDILKIIQQDKNKALVALCFQLQNFKIKILI